MDYGRLVLQRWDQGAGRIPDLQVYGPTPIARMTQQLFGENGIYAGDIARAPLTAAASTSSRRAAARCRVSGQGRASLRFTPAR